MVMETLPSSTVLHGRYRIERILGSGGFGHVYLAVDLQTSSQYAIKEYLVTGSSGKAQLEHEARVLSQLHHPSLPAFQAAFDERGRYYIVLSYIEGSDLTDYVRAVRQHNEIIPLALSMNWLLSICDAVTFLHAQHPPIIHRDIKPDNIRITPSGTAVLVDLGNAKAAADGARTLFFIRHQGTPGYAPLEQYPGGSGTDVRSDVYALGGTLYFALTAHEPPSVSTRNQSIQQGLPDLPSLQEQLAHNPPETSTDPNAGKQFRLGVSKPSKPAPRHSRHLAQLSTLSPELLDRLNAIIKRAMEMKPRDRYQSVVDFSNDLHKVLAALPPSTQPKSSRKVDPHSTQPDLPFLYEDLQHTKGHKDSTPVDTPTIPVSPVSPPPAAPVHCPRCNAELARQAVFCPHCGNPLTNISNSNAPATPPAISGFTTPKANGPAGSPTARNHVAAQDASAERTIVIAPKSTRSARATTYPAPQTPSSPPSPRSASDAQDKVRQPANPPASKLFLSQPPPQAPPRPFIQSGTTAPTLVSQPQTPQQPQTVAAPVNIPPARAVSSNGLHKLFVIAAILFVVVILAIVFLILLAAGRTHSHQPSSSRNAYSYSIEAQVVTYERNFSLCITSSATPALAGIRACRPGIPPTVGITERMAGSRVRHTPGNQRDWLT